jgi:hypothetical protein
MENNRIWFSTVQAAFILELTDRAIRNKVKTHISDTEMVILVGKNYKISDLFLSFYRKSLRNNSENDEIINDIKKSLSEGNVVETFTPEKYAVFENTLKDYEKKSVEIKELETKIKYLDKEIVGLIQDKTFLQSQLDKSKDALAQNQWILGKYLNEKN